ncbi:MAG: hypothetical protein ACREUZ_17500 [Burkholderiales bacterium]
MIGARTADEGRRALLPASGIPLLYFGFAHICLAVALGVLVVHPNLPGGFFHHPRMIAVVHLVTLGWISGSILGAFYIVCPLALRLPIRPGWRDRLAFGSFAVGVIGMVAHFWLGEYSGIAWSALLVAAAVLHVALRAWLGLPRAPVPWPVKLHVALAFANMILASMFGMLIGLNRMYGWLPWPPLSAAFAHAHLPAVGWAVMMVVGLSYRLIPMIIPAEMPRGRSMATSAVLLEIGTLGLAVALLTRPGWSPVAALVIVAGIASFVRQVRSIVKRKLPPPAALPRPDWATWQTHIAFVWLVIAACTGLALTLPVPPASTIELGWVYGTAGLIGFLAQIVVGIQGRLLPLYGWYRMMERGNMRPPPRSAHALANPGLAKAILLSWTLGVPLLVSGLAADINWILVAGSALLLGGVVLNAAQAVTIVTSDEQPRGEGVRTAC